jgi:two-component system, LytTR family, response regulator
MTSKETNAEIMKSLKVVLVDDEKSGLNSLSVLLKKYVPQAEIVAQCNSAESAIDAIRNFHPQENNLVFLDIEMPHYNGFELLEKVKDLNFEVIFTTAFQQYAVKAFKYNAADYLLKPVDPDELRSAIVRIENRFMKRENRSMKELLSSLQATMEDENRRIALHTSEGVELIAPSQIVRCEAQQSYTVFVLSDGVRIMVSKNLGEMETLLPQHLFMRVHKSHLINIHFIKKYIKTDGGSLLMSDGTQVDISRMKKEEILSRLHLHSL